MLNSVTLITVNIMSQIAIAVLKIGIQIIIE